MSDRFEDLSARALDLYGEAGGELWVHQWREGDDAKRERLEALLAEFEEWMIR